MNISGRFLIKHFGDCDSSGQNCVKVYLRYPVFSYPVTDIFDSINAFINTLILKPPFIHYQIKTPQDIFDYLSADYRRLQQDFDGYQSGWELLRQIEVLFNRKNILCLNFNEYIYTGGAHPAYTRLFYIFDLNTGKRLGLSDIIDPQKYDSLLHYIEAEFRSQKGLAKDQDLLAAGFWFPENRFTLNQNFGAVDDGVIVYYNYYEIAPYAMGPTEIFINCEEMKYFLSQKNLFSKRLIKIKRKILLSINIR